MTLQVAGLPGNGIGGGKPIQSSHIRTVVAAETARRPCQPGSFRVMLQCENTMERKKKKKGKTFGVLNGKRKEGLWKLRVSTESLRV